jgi:hypothetical protein
VGAPHTQLQVAQRQVQLHRPFLLQDLGEGPVDPAAGAPTYLPGLRLLRLRHVRLRLQHGERGLVPPHGALVFLFAEQLRSKLHAG